MKALARWCFRHRFLVAGVWFAALVLATVAGRVWGAAYQNSLDIPGTGSTRAVQLLKHAFPTQAGDTDTIVWHATGPVSDPSVHARIDPMLATVARAPHVVRVTSGPARTSADGHTAYATVSFDRPQASLHNATYLRVIHEAEKARAPGLQVELGGPGIEAALQPSVSFTVVIGLVAAACILFVAFGSWAAMTLPLVNAVAALGTAMPAIGAFSHVMSISSVAEPLGMLIGLGVGVDYALFVVSRHRTALQTGVLPEDAAATALDTSGRAVLFAGGTVSVAILGVLTLGVPFLNGMALATVGVVLATVAAAVTLLPALLGILGQRVQGRRPRGRWRTARPAEDDAAQRSTRLGAGGPASVDAGDEARAGGRSSTGNGTAGVAGVGAGSVAGVGAGGVAGVGAGGVAGPGGWARWAEVVRRRALPLGLAATVVMLVLAVPFLGMRLGTSDAGNDPAGTTTRKSYDLLARGFGPGFNGPLQLVVQSPRGTGAPAALTAVLPRTPGVASVSPPVSNQSRTVTVVQVTPATAPQAQATSDLIHRLRTRIIPGALRGTGDHAYVGGPTAANDDLGSRTQDRLPIFLTVVVGLGSLLLLLAFRSVLVPVTAAVMNLLSAAATFGVLTAVFQWGWGLSPLGAGRAGPVEAFLPVFVLAILFGLSMDYEVFLVSRIHEEWRSSRDNARAIGVGQAAGGRVITAAAAIMICVFAAFALAGVRVTAEFGVGLAVAVALDAFLLRTVLVPAIMHGLGRANWWLPRRLDRMLPQVSVEPPSSEPEDYQRSLRAAIGSS
jgi:RND superfamily putative drug exporter